MENQIITREVLLTPAQKEQRYEAITKNFRVFVEEIMGYDNPEFLNEIDNAISNRLYSKIAIAIARGHGKSTHLSIAYPLWRMALNHNVRILLISNTADVSTSFITQILNQIEGNTQYQQWARWVDPLHVGVVPKIRKIAKREEKWASSAITIDRGSLNLKDPTVRAMGLFGGIVSKRADIIIADDICNQDNTQVEDQREKTKSWMRTTVMPVLTGAGRFVCLGNTWHEDDAMMTFLRDPQFDYTKKLPAVEHFADREDLWQEWAKIRTDQSLGQSDEVQGKKIEDAEEFYQANKEEMDKGVKLLFPYDPEKSKFDDRGELVEQYGFKYGDLYLERMADSYSFARMRQCNPADRPDQSFKETWLDNMKKKGRELRLSNTIDERLDLEIITMGQDLAASEHGDDNVLLALARVRASLIPLIDPGDIVILNIDRGKLPKYTPKYVRDTIVEWDSIFNPAGIRVESNAYQKSIALDLQNSSIPIHGFVTGGEKNDPEIGVGSLAILAENGKLVIPYDLNDPRTIELSSKLIDEMRRFPDGHTGDSLMAMWFAWSEIREKGGKTLRIPRTLVQEMFDNAEKVVHLTPEELREQDRLNDLEVMKKAEAARRGVVYIPPAPAVKVEAGVKRKLVF
jgi:hypothetical protein